MHKNKIFLSTLAAFALSGCSFTQEPVAVIEGGSRGTVWQPAQVTTSLRPVPGIEAQPVAVSNAGILDAEVQTYTVLPGDTLRAIAEENYISVESLRTANNLGVNDGIYAGQQIVIPQYGNEGQRALFAQKTTEQPTQTERYSLTRNRFEGANAAMPTGVNTTPTQDAMAPEVVAEQVTAQSKAPTTPAANLQTHTVAPGETLYRISRRYNTTIENLMRANRINSPQDLSVGQTLTIPGASASPKDKLLARVNRAIDGVPAPNSETTAASAQSAVTETDAAQNAKAAKRIARSINPRFAGMPGKIWPVEGGQLARGFGQSGSGITHTGLNITAEAGTPIMAIDDGEVIYAGNGLASYGNMILVRHRDGLVSAYGHNQQNFVVRGDKVRKGEVIATIGNTGSVAAPQLHFEVRRDAKPLDPLGFIRQPQG